MNAHEPLTIVSNRLPVVLGRADDGSWSISPGSGGLVQALDPILERRGGRWCGWPGLATEEIAEEPLPLSDLDTHYSLHAVELTERHIERYYRGFANSVVWPLFHNFPDRCSFEPEFWEDYIAVNRKFADTVGEVVEDGEAIWVHDYHLMNLAQLLRERANPGRIGFFLHIPFPSLENFVKLPWRADLLRALLSYDLLGFQTARDRRNFLACVERLMPEVECEPDALLARIETADREVAVGAFPIGIDFDEWSDRARSSEVEERARLLEREIGPYRVLLGVDRLDYTKGLLERLHALERAFERHPDLVEDVMLFQLVVPSREDVPEYAALKREVDRTVGRINGRFSTSSWQPIRYLYNTVDKVELTALYRLAEVGMVTPLYDGMNLVCKEYVASQVAEPGVLILGEMAGAAAQLADDALLVNPYDIDGTADAIERAVTMSRPDRQARMDSMRTIVDETNVFRWAESFLHAMHEQTSLEQESESEYLPHIDAPR